MTIIFSKIRRINISDTIVNYLIPGWVGHLSHPSSVQSCEGRSSLDNLRADAIWYPRTDDVPERRSLALGAHNLLSRQVAITADCPNKDGPYCLRRLGKPRVAVKRRTLLRFFLFCFVYLCLFIIFRSELWCCRFDSLLFDSYHCHTIDSLHCRSTDS